MLLKNEKVMTTKMFSFFPELEFYLDICPFSDYSMATSLQECFKENEKNLDVKTIRKVLNGQETSLRTEKSFRQGLTREPLWVIVIGSSIWVLIDAMTIGVKRGQIQGVANMGPWNWFFDSLLLWIVVFSFYFAKRSEFKSINGK